MIPSPREIRAGLIDQEADDAPCIECGLQGVVYLLDHQDAMWLTCNTHTGPVAVQLLRGELNGARPSFPSAYEE